MSNNKQSSVEWFAEEINIHLNFDQRLYLRALIEQAKAMHKEEIKLAFVLGKLDDAISKFNATESKGSEQYYNETFGGNK